MFSLIEDFIKVYGTLMIGVASGVVLAAAFPTLYAIAKKVVTVIATKYSTLKTEVAEDLAKRAALAKITVASLDSKIGELETATANAVQNLHKRLLAVEATILPVTSNTVVDNTVVNNTTTETPNAG